MFVQRCATYSAPLGLVRSRVAQSPIPLMPRITPLNVIVARDPSSFDTPPEFDYRALARQALAQDIAALQRQSLTGTPPAKLYEHGWGAALLCALAGGVLLVAGLQAGLELKRWLIGAIGIVSGLQLTRAALRAFWLQRQPYAVLSHKGVWLPDLNTLVPWDQITGVSTEEQLNLSAGASTIVSKRIILTMAAGYQPPRSASKGSRTRYAAKSREYVLPCPTREMTPETAFAALSRYWQANAALARATASADPKRRAD